MSALPDVIQVLILILCAMGVALAIILIVVAVRLLRLADDIRTRLDSQVTPLLIQTLEATSRLNRLLSSVSNLTNLVGTVGSLAGSKLAPVGAGQKLAYRVGRAAANWLANTLRTATANKQKKTTEEAPE